MLLSTSTLRVRLVLLPGAHAHSIRTRDCANLAADKGKKKESKILITFLHKYPSSVVGNTNAYETIIFINPSYSN